MTTFALRFDFRNPEFARTSMAERYAAAIDMAQWADTLGFATVLLSEHHGSADGYLPSPITVAAAIAARTTSVRIQLAAVIAPFYDPLRLAEDLAVLDNLSGGRLDLVIANGYVPAEFAMFGCALADRAARTVEVVTTLRQAWTGEPFQFRGRTVRVQPVPAQPGGPKIALGGSSLQAARRAAHIADGFMPTDGSLWKVYREEACALGKSDPGPFMGGDTSAFHLSRDPERGWQEYAPYALHEANAYAVWLTAAGDESGQLYQATVDADALRASGQYRVLTPGDMLDELVNTNEAGVAIFHPMVGGLPPDQAWESLRLFEHEVLPKLTSSRRSLRGG